MKSIGLFLKEELTEEPDNAPCYVKRGGRNIEIMYNKAKRGEGMIRIDLYGEVDFEKVDLKEIREESIPDFASFIPNFEEIQTLTQKYKDYKSLIIIGNGGSITSFWAFYKCLAEYKSQKEVFILSTMDPDLVSSLKGKCSKEGTLIIAISKSGDTVGVLEDLFAFEGYPVVAITTEGKGALWEIAQRRGWDYLIIPQPIGGRFSGRTPCGYFPASLLGIDIAGIDEGANQMYEMCRPTSPLKENPALRLACFLYLLDQMGYTEIFHPVYSPRLEGFIPLLIQLIHESTGKEGKGQTIYGSLAPESQHHTNQRFFGGRRNVCGLFLIVEEFDQEMVTSVPMDLKDIGLQNQTLMVLDGIPLNRAVFFEYLGTQQDALKNSIPHAVVVLKKITPQSVGQFLALIHYLAVYSSLLRGVNPFDQPQVEASKKISFSLRRDFKR
ncbi:TPA: hypothetical protein DCX15_05710 [bacterium]|nr:hypothetical protein [bacterium]